MKQRMKLPVSVHLFLRRGDEILLLRRYNTGYEDGKYSVVAGHIDGGESVFEAMIREAQEEAGILLNKEYLIPVQVMHRKKPDGEYIDYFFAADCWNGEIKNAEPHKCDELNWYKIDKLPENMVEYVRCAIKNHMAEISFSSFGWE